MYQVWCIKYDVSGYQVSRYQGSIKGIKYDVSNRTDCIAWVHLPDRRWGWAARRPRRTLWRRRPTTSCRSPPSAAAAACSSRRSGSPAEGWASDVETAGNWKWSIKIKTWIRTHGLKVSPVVRDRLRWNSHSPNDHSLSHIEQMFSGEYDLETSVGISEIPFFVVLASSRLINYKTFCALSTLTPSSALWLTNAATSEKKYSGAQIRTRARWVRSANATSVLCRPPKVKILVRISKILAKMTSPNV